MDMMTITLGIVAASADGTTAQVFYPLRRASMIRARSKGLLLTLYYAV
jgi:hypothetical protein